jgi:exosortase/archaeosortase family protein
MAALMLGELYRLTPWRRVALIPAGFAIAIAANVARTSFLTWSAARQGFARMENWHGPAGIAVVFVVLGGLWLTAYLLSKRKDEGGNPKAEGQSQEQGAGSREQGFADHRQPTSGFRPPTSDLPHPTSAFQFSVFQRFSFSFQGPWSVVSGPFLAAAFGWLVFTEAFTVVWFHLGAKRAQTNPAWSINWPTNAVGYREIPLRKAELEMLRYDTARNTAWQDANGNQWSFIALHWGPKNKHSFIGRGHTPDECFVGGGWKLCGQPDPVRLCINGLDLPFRRYLFEFDGKTAYVFLALWDERSPGGKQELPLAYGIKRRLQAAWEGKRHQGLKKLEISIIGPSSSEEALQVLQKGLEELIIVEGEKAQTLKTEMLKPANTMAEG